MKIKLKKKQSKIIVAVATGLAIATVLGVFVSLFANRHKNNTIVTGTGSTTGFAQPFYGVRDEDYASLYETEGLVACYMAYDASSVTGSMVETENGFEACYSWRNFVPGGKNAVLKNIHAWSSMDGGVGYRWYQDSEERQAGACEIPYEEYITVNDYEVEMVAKFLGVTDRNTGKMYHEKSDDTYLFQENTTFRFGLFHSVSFLTSSNRSNFDRLNRWYAANSPYKTHYNAVSDTCKVLSVGDSIFHNYWWDADQYAVTMDFGNVTKEDGYHPYLDYRFKGETASLLWGEGSSPVPITVDDAPYTDKVSRFTLFNEYPCVLYSVRLYNRALSSEEKLRNSFVDLLAFYEINVSSILTLDEESRETFLNSCAALADHRDIVMGNMDEKIRRVNHNEMLNIIRECWPQ